MQNPTTIELGNHDSIVITKDGKVVGFVQVKRVFNNNVELVANPVTYSGNWNRPQEERIYHSFATTGATNVETPEDLATAENFIALMNKKVVA